MAFDLEELTQEFIEEAMDNLDGLDAQLIALENPDAEDQESLLNSVFRAVHSIKGSSSYMGYDNISKLAHQMENILSLFRTKEIVPNSESVSVLLRSADQLRLMVDHVEDSESIDVSSFIEQLESLVGQPKTNAPSSATYVEQAAPHATTHTNQEAQAVSRSVNNHAMSSPNGSNATNQTRPANQPSQPVQSQARAALVIDDEPAIVRMLAARLATAGITVDVANNATEGLKKLSEKYYPVVITDIQMPDISGVQLVNRIHDHNPFIRIIVLTADESPETTALCMSLGACDYFLKGQEFSLLATAVSMSMCQAARWQTGHCATLVRRCVADD